MKSTASTWLRDRDLRADVAFAQPEGVPIGSVVDIRFQHRGLRVHLDQSVEPAWDGECHEPVLGVSVPVNRNTLIDRWYVHRIGLHSEGTTRQVRIGAEAFGREPEWFALDGCEMTERGLSTPAVEVSSADRADPVSCLVADLQGVAATGISVDAEQSLSAAKRLEDQLRPGGPIKDPVGSLIGKGLPQRQTSSAAQRQTVAAAVDTAMPYTSPEERRTVTERRLRERVTAHAWAREHRWEQERARRVAAEKARAEAAAACPAIDEPAAPLASCVLPATRPALAAPVPEPEADVADEGLVLENLTREQVLQVHADD